MLSKNEIERVEEVSIDFDPIHESIDINNDYGTTKGKPSKKLEMMKLSLKRILIFFMLKKT